MDLMAEAEKAFTLRRKQGRQLSVKDAQAALKRCRDPEDSLLYRYKKSAARADAHNEKTWDTQILVRSDSAKTLVH